MRRCVTPSLYCCMWSTSYVYTCTSCRYVLSVNCVHTCTVTKQRNNTIALIDGLQAHLRRWMEVVVTTVSQTQRRGEEVQICLLIMEMFHMLPASTFRLFEPLLALCLKGEKSLGTEVCVCLCIVCVSAYMY